MATPANTMVSARPGYNTLRRHALDILGWIFAAVAFLILSGAIIWILFTIFERGAKSLNPGVLIQITEGTGGGLLNAIQGTLVLALGGVSLAIPPGIAAGVYLAEFDAGPFASAIRFLSDVLVGVPSIVIGYFGYVSLVVEFGWGFSAAAGCIALAIMALPYICRTSEMAFRQVPRDLREGAYSLGATEAQTLWTVSLPIALPGILTGVLLALAISVGETAPLLYTAGWSNYLWTGHLTHEPVGYLTYVIWAFISEPFTSAHALAYGAALLVTLFVLVIGILSRVVLQRSTVRGR